MDQVSRILQHDFDDWARALMEARPLLSDRHHQLIFGSNVTSYRSQYGEVAIRENGEPLVDCAEYGLVSREFHLTKLCQGERAFMAAVEQGILHPTVRVRRGIATALGKVDQKLREHGLFIFVMSGWRSPQLQRIAINWASSKFGEASASRRFATPTTTPHATGGACDLELYSLQCMESLTKVDEGDDISFHGPELKEALSEPERLKRGVRRILYHAVTTGRVGLSADERLTIHPGEAWHFGRGDSFTALLRDEPFAIYGPVDDIEAIAGLDCGSAPTQEAED
jgi:D-alanyl-D-alanine dipeptidase